MDGNTIFSTAVLITLLVGFFAIGVGYFQRETEACDEMLDLEAIEAHVAARTGHRHL